MGFRDAGGSLFARLIAQVALTILCSPLTVGMSALLLLYVNWGALQAECLRKDTCDIWEASQD